MDRAIPLTAIGLLVAILAIIVTGNILLGNIRSEISSVRNEVATVKNEVAGVRNEVATVKNEVASVRNDVAGVRTEVATVKNEVAGVRNEVASVKVDLEKGLGAVRVEVADLRAAMTAGFARLENMLTREVFTNRENIHRLEQRVIALEGGAP